MTSIIDSTPTTKQTTLTTTAHKRHDINDRTWTLLSPHLTGQKGMHGGIAKDNRLFLNAVFWIVRTGAAWRDLPLIMATGKTRIGASAIGAIKACGIPYYLK